MIKKSLLLALYISSNFSPLTANAALPMTVKSQSLPSLAPMLERVAPAVVSIVVEGKYVSKQLLPKDFHYFFGPNFPLEQVKERPFKGLGSGVIIDSKKGISSPTIM